MRIFGTVLSVYRSSSLNVKLPRLLPVRFSTDYLTLILLQIRRKFSALMVSMDTGVQQLTEALKSKGMYDNTIFIFTGDNGGWL